MFYETREKTKTKSSWEIYTQQHSGRQLKKLLFFLLKLFCTHKLISYIILAYWLILMFVHRRWFTILCTYFLFQSSSFTYKLAKMWSALAFACILFQLMNNRYSIHRNSITFDDGSRRTTETKIPKRKMCKKFGFLLRIHMRESTKQK